MKQLEEIRYRRIFEHLQELEMSDKVLNLISEVYEKQGIDECFKSYLHLVGKEDIAPIDEVLDGISMVIGDLGLSWTKENVTMIVASRESYYLGFIQALRTKGGGK